MIDLAILAGCLLLVTGAGAAIATGLRCGEGGRSGFGWSFLLGVAVLALALHVPLAVDGRIPPASFAAAMVACGALTAWHLGRGLVFRGGGDAPGGNVGRTGDGFRWGTSGWVADLPRPLRWVAALVAASALFSVITTPMNTYDGRAAFALKARVLLDEGTVLGEDFQDFERLHFNSHYPLLIPLLMAQANAARGTPDDRFTRAIFALFVAALISVVAAELRRHASRRAAATGGLLLLLVPMVVTTYEGGGLSASADLPMACFATAAMIAAGRWLREPGVRPALAAGTLLGAACMTKVEGLVWVVAVAGAGAVGLASRGGRLARSRPASALAGVAAVAAFVGASELARGGIPHSPYLRDYGEALRLEWLAQVWGRPLDIVRYALREFARASAWSLFWPCAAGGFALLRRAADRRPVAADVRLARTGAILVGVAYAAMFVVTPYHLHFQLRTAFPRLSLHLLPLIALLLAEHVMASEWTRGWRGLRRASEGGR